LVKQTSSKPWGNLDLDKKKNSKNYFFSIVEEIEPKKFSIFRNSEAFFDDFETCLSTFGFLQNVGKISFQISIL